MHHNLILLYMYFISTTKELLLILTKVMQSGTLAPNIDYIYCEHLLRDNNKC